MRRLGEILDGERALEIALGIDEGALDAVGFGLELQKRRELRLAAGATMIDHELPGDRPGRLGAEILLDHGEREVEIMRLLGEGRSLTEIADSLGIAYKTVANTCTQSRLKLGVARTADLIRLSIEMGIK